MLCTERVQVMSRSTKESTQNKRTGKSPRTTGKASGSTRARAHTTAKRPASELSQLLQPGEESQDAADMPTARQMEIYEFIRDRIYSRGFGPTVREIGGHFLYARQMVLSVTSRH